MNKKQTFILLFCFLLFISENQVTGNKTDIFPVDKYATTETVNLLRNLRDMSGKALLIGQTDANVMGISANGKAWYFNDDSCDIKAIINDYPAIYGFDILKFYDLKVDTDRKLKFSLIRIKEAYKRGGIITLSLHLRNPLTGESFNTGSPVKDIIPGKQHSEKLTAILDSVAQYFGNLKDNNGNSIPIIFRPWHEQNGNHFWWGKNRCTIDEYKTLFRFTVEYLRDAKKVHNFLYAFSPGDYNNFENYMERYPGDDCVDIIGLDSYGDDSKEYTDRLKYYLHKMVDIAQKKNKIAAITEFGFKLSEDSAGIEYCKNLKWLTETVLRTILADDVTKKIVYVVFWRNEAYNPKVFYLPRQGSLHEKDLIDFYNDPITIFNKDLPPMYSIQE